MGSQGLAQIKNGVEKSLDGMVKRGKSTSSYMNRALFRQFQEAQKERWQTQGSSQGQEWKPVSPKYAQWKRRRFSGYPGGGNVTLVRTGELMMGAQARSSSNFYKVVDDRSFVIGINLGTLPYAKYPGKTRPFMAFSESTLRKWHRGIREYICKGVG